jgi:hypothetical protein
MKALVDVYVTQGMTDLEKWFFVFVTLIIALGASWRTWRK